MSWPSSKTRPLTRAPGIVSCIRFRQRRNVDLPQPEGPMIAVTVRSSTSMFTLRIACAAPKCASRADTAMRGATSMTAPTERAPGSASFTACSGGRCSVAGSVSPARRDAGGDADDADDADEDEGARPREAVPLVVRTCRIVVYPQRKRVDRSRERRRPEHVAECREDERRGFAGDAGHRYQRAGDDAAKGGAQHDRECGAPARIA